MTAGELTTLCARCKGEAMHNESPPDLIPTAAVCAELNVTASTVSRWVAKGQLVPAAKAPGLRGGYLFTRAAIDALKAA